MVIKIYVSGISGNKEVKKRQQRVLMILESKNVEYQVIDITEPGKEAEKEYMQVNSVAKDSKYPLPPQIFNEEDYCGDYEGFDLANEMDELETFLKGTAIGSRDNSKSHQNGNASSREPSTDKDAISNDGSHERRESDSDNLKHTNSESEIKDLTEDDLDLGNDDDKKDEDENNDDD